MLVCLSCWYRGGYGQAVRTLRSALNINSKKEFSMFCRSEGDFNVNFALREVTSA